MKNVDPSHIIPPAGMSGVPLLGRREIQVMVSQLCVNCFPKPEPAIFTWGGMSLCQKCLTPLRQEVDKDKNIRINGIGSRDYKATWGQEPIEDAETI
jgi:hypothetical protein